MKKLGITISAIYLIGSLSMASLTSSAIFAGQQQQQQGQQGQTAKLDAATERKAYDAYNTANKEADCTKKLTMAKEALGLYPTSQYAPYFKDLVKQARGCLVETSLKESVKEVPKDEAQKTEFLKKLEVGFSAGADVLAEEPDNLNFLLLLSDISGRLAKRNEYTFAEKGTEHAKKVIELINAGKAPLGIMPEDWAKRKSTVLAGMYQNLGLFALKAQKDEDALQALVESAKQDCADPVTHYLIGQVHNNKYVALSNQYNALDNEKKSSDEGKAILEKVNGIVDQIVEAYGKMMAVSDGKQGFDGLRNRIKPALEDFYKFRHEQKLDGLDTMITNLKATACPSKE
jgi:hypothetical protein